MACLLFAVIATSLSFTFLDPMLEPHLREVSVYQLNKWINQWMNQSMNESINEWMNQSMNCSSTWVQSKSAVCSSSWPWCTVFVLQSVVTSPIPPMGNQFQRLGHWYENWLIDWLIDWLIVTGLLRRPSLRRPKSTARLHGQQDVGRVIGIGLALIGVGLGAMSAPLLKYMNDAAGCVLIYFD